MDSMAVDAPADVAQDLTRLAAALDASVPAKSASNLLIATWNVRAFGDLTTKWDAGPRGSPKRDWHAVACIAEVVSRFDVIVCRKSAATPPRCGSCSNASALPGGSLPPMSPKAWSGTANASPSSITRTASSPPAWSGKSSSGPAGQSRRWKMNVCQ